MACRYKRQDIRCISLKAFDKQPGTWGRERTSWVLTLSEELKDTSLDDLGACLKQFIWPLGLVPSQRQCTRHPTSQNYRLHFHAGLGNESLLSFKMDYSSKIISKVIKSGLSNQIQSNHVQSAFVCETAAAGLCIICRVGSLSLLSKQASGYFVVSQLMTKDKQEIKKRWYKNQSSEHTLLVETWPYLCQQMCAEKVSSSPWSPMNVVARKYKCLALLYGTSRMMLNYR